MARIKNNNEIVLDVIPPLFKVTNFRSKLVQVLWLVLPELATYLIVYGSLNVLYRFLPEKDDLTRLVSYLEIHLQNMARDLTFLLGFYVTTIAKRWWDQFSHLPVPDNLAIYLSGIIVVNPPQDFQALKMTLMRLAMASWILCLKRFSPRLKDQFPNLEAIQQAGLLTHEEVTKLHQYQQQPTNPSDCGGGEEDEDALQLWMRPLNWAANLVKRAKARHVIGNDAKEIWRELVRFRDRLQILQDYNLNPLPYVYKIVVVTAVYAYLMISVIAEQDIGQSHIQLYVPIFGLLKVIFFVGWLKVSTAMENPMSSDIQLDLLLERHICALKILVSDDEDDQFFKNQLKY